MSNSTAKNKKAFKELKMVLKNVREVAFKVYKQSIQDLIEEASLPQRKGGKMHVDTGFLRSSGVAAINKVPEGQAEGRRRQAGEKGVLLEYSKYDAGTTVQNALINLKPNDTFYFGWTARYALIREIYDGFLESACDKWQFFLDKNFKKVAKGNFRAWSQYMNAKYGG